MSGNAFRRPGGKASDGAAGALLIEPGGRDMPPIGAEIDKPGIRWDMMMNLFLRLMAMVWMFKGVAYWAIILGLGEGSFAQEPRLRQAFFIGFALLDCSASVGLWLLSPWGKSLWVFVAVAECLIGAARLGEVLSPQAAMGAGLSLFFFFVLTFAVRQRQLGKF
jgi:hypothetical protein